MKFLFDNARERAVMEMKVEEFDLAFEDPPEDWPFEPGNGPGPEQDGNGEKDHEQQLNLDEQIETVINNGDHGHHEAEDLAVIKPEAGACDLPRFPWRRAPHGPPSGPKWLRPSERVRFIGRQALFA